jgi:hypothetical protein
MSRHSVWVILVSVLSGTTLPVSAQDTTVFAGDTAVSRTLPASEPLTGKVTLSADLLCLLPIDDVRQALHLVPGVILRGAALAPDGATAAAVRGGVAGEASAYIDGAPVRLETLGIQGITLAPFMVAELGVETGVTHPSLPDTRGGVMSYITPTGGPSLRGRLRAETDEAFGDRSTVGYSWFEGMLGGPAPGVRNLTFFAAAQVQGQRSQYRGVGAEDQPTYVLGGLDTTVQLSDGSNLYVPRFVQWSGDCGGCVGLRRPMDWTTNIRLLGKLHYELGDRSSVSLTGLATGRQDRFFPGSEIGAPSLYRGAHTWSRLVVANLRHRLRGADQNGPTLHVNLSYAVDRAISGPLTTPSDAESREPGLGIELGTLSFTGLEVLPFPITERIVRNFRTGSGLRVPYLGRSDLLNQEVPRRNPFGLANGWPSAGLETELALLSERRVIGRAFVEWGLAPRHGLMVGAEAAATDLSFHSSRLLDQFFAEVFVAEPRRYALFASDRFSAGALTLDVGFRVERLDSGSELPTVPGVIFNHPAWNLDAATDDTAYANSVARVMTPNRAHRVFSPRVRAGYALGRTQLRLAWGQHLEPPSYADLFAGANSDMISGNTNASEPFGRDVELAERSVLELAASHEFGIRVGAGLSFYRTTPAFAYGFRTRPYANPRDVTDTIQPNSLTRLDDGVVLGLDASLASRLSGHVGASVVYSLASVRPHDISHPFTGQRLDSPALTTHGLSAVITAAVPPGWREGTALGTLATGFSGVAVFRAVSGLPYTRLINQGDGHTVPDGNLFGQPLELPNSSRLPWTRHLDLRINKDVRLGPLNVTAYADIRNLFDFRNTERLFAETGDVVNALRRQREVGDPAIGTGEYLALWNEAQQNGALAGRSTVDLRACATWSSPENCVALGRVERRFGDGDGLYTQAEQERALNTFYDSFFGPWRFYGPGRTARIGLAFEF